MTSLEKGISMMAWPNHYASSPTSDQHLPTPGRISTTLVIACVIISVGCDNATPSDDLVEAPIFDTPTAGTNPPISGQGASKIVGGPQAGDASSGHGRAIHQSGEPGQNVSPHDREQSQSPHPGNAGASAAGTPSAGAVHPAPSTGGFAIDEDEHMAGGEINVGGRVSTDGGASSLGEGPPGSFAGYQTGHGGAAMPGGEPLAPNIGGIQSDSAGGATGAGGRMAGAPSDPSDCQSPLDELQYETWSTTIGDRCAGCHVPPGQATDRADFLLEDPDNPGVGQSRRDVFAGNLQTLIEFGYEHSGMPYLLAKATHTIPHEGGQVIRVGDDSFRAIVALLAKQERWASNGCVDDMVPLDRTEEAFERLSLRNPADTFRRMTVQLLGRLPTEEERSFIASADDEVTGMARVGERLANIFEADGFHRWLKDAWNDVFLFRGIYAQDLDWAYEVLPARDYGARLWADLCDHKMPLTDDDGEFLPGNGHQPVCNKMHERFSYPTVGQPNHHAIPSERHPYRHLASLEPVQACDYCSFGRHGLSHWVGYGVVEEPLELIAYIIKNQRPFSEILTTQTVMMNYYSSLAYFGTAAPNENDFTAAMDDVPTHTALIQGQSKVVFDVEVPDHRVFKPIHRVVRTSYYRPKPEGFQYNQAFMNVREPVQFERAGILTSAAFMKRFPSTAVNHNRHRAWQAMRLFLDYDILENQGDRESLAEIGDPNQGVTVRDPSCNSCHSVLDPIAGLFQNFDPMDGHSLHPNDWDFATAYKWSPQLHRPGTGGLGGDVVHYDPESGQAPIRFLANAILSDRRFVTTMIRHAWRQVIGVEPLVGIDGLDEHAVSIRRTLIDEQQQFLSDLEAGFIQRNLDMLWVYRQLFVSKWYRIDRLVGLDNDAADADDVAGANAQVARFGPITPEHYARKIEAVLGEPWPLKVSGGSTGMEELLKDNFFYRTDTEQASFNLHFGLIDPNFAAFFGGIDFLNTLKRADLITSMMSLITKRVANEFACIAVPSDFARVDGERRFFPHVSLDDDENSDGGIARIRSNLVHLFQRILGLDVAPHSEAIEDALQLWVRIRQAGVAEIQSDGNQIILYGHCLADGFGPGPGVPHAFDADYTLRAWMAIVSYLLLQPEFIQH